MSKAADCNYSYKKSKELIRLHIFHRIKTRPFQTPFKLWCRLLNIAPDFKEPLYYHSHAYIKPICNKKIGLFKQSLPEDAYDHTGKRQQARK